MQNILSLDISAKPTVLQIVAADGEKIEVLETVEVDTGDLFSKERITGSGNAETLSTEPFEPNSLTTEILPFKSALGSLKHPWTSAVLLLPPIDYLSFNLDLPFSNPKSIAKIIDLEIQDRVPFDAAEFLIEHNELGRLSPTEYDVHVSAVPKALIETILEICRRAEVDPVVITTHASAAGSLHTLQPSLVAPDSALIVAKDPFYSMAFVVGE